MTQTLEMSNTARNDKDATWFRAYRTQRRKVDEEMGVLRNIAKKAKADGVNTKAMIAAIALTKLDPEVVAADVRDTIRYAAIMHVPMTQAVLFNGWDETVSERTAEIGDLWQAEQEGFTAGRAGAAVESSPYITGTEHHTHWLDHWHKGQASIARELGDNVKQASGAKARPKRDGQVPLEVVGGTGEKPVPEVVVLQDVVKRPRKPSTRRAAAH